MDNNDNPETNSSDIFFYFFWFAKCERNTRDILWNEEFQNLTHNIISEFLEATVSYELESPTVSLEDVFFPSVVLCNMNILRQSFIMALMKDPDLKSRTSYEELFLLVDEHFIQGIKENLTEKEEVIKKSNIFFYKLINTQHCS